MTCSEPAEPVESGLRANRQPAALQYRRRSASLAVPISPIRLLEPPSEQAHVPAEQPPPREDAWLPAAHAHSRRPGHPRRPSPQGPSGPLGLTPRALDPLVLPAASRLRRRPDFTATVRRGRRAGRSRLVVHLDVAVPGSADFSDSRSDSRESSDPVSGPPRVGFVVGRAVGGAVVRNRVRRQLRHLVGGRLDVLPTGVRVVVRALPAAAGSSSTELAADLDAALARALRSAGFSYPLPTGHSS